MSIWASWGEEDDIHPVAYEGSGHYPGERGRRWLMDFAHIPAHLNRAYRRQRWLRVGLADDAGSDVTFCLNGKEARKLIAALDHFVNQPGRAGRGE